MLNVSTKTGDKGETGLANGERVAKDSQRLVVLGAVDELNSWLGMAAVELLDSLPKQRLMILKIQDSLFYLSAELALSPKTKFKKKSLESLEKVSEALQRSLSEGWTSKFLLPGGTRSAATLDIARTVCRRAERQLVTLGKEEEVRSTLLQYLNRLSDYLFVLRCAANEAGGYEENKFVSK